MIESVLLIGAIDGMESVVAAVVRHCRQLVRYSSLNDVAAVEDSPQLIVVVQQFPDEYPSSEVLRLLSDFPISRLICCYGPWCAADGRTRNIWPPAVRVPIGEFEHRLLRERDVIAGTEAALDRTAGLDELFPFDHPALSSPIG